MHSLAGFLYIWRSKDVQKAFKTKSQGMEYYMEYIQNTLPRCSISS